MKYPPYKVFIYYPEVVEQFIDTSKTASNIQIANNASNSLIAIPPGEEKLFLSHFSLDTGVEYAKIQFTYRQNQSDKGSRRVLLYSIKDKKTIQKLYDVERQ